MSNNINLELQIIVRNKNDENINWYNKYFARNQINLHKNKNCHSSSLIYVKQ